MTARAARARRLSARDRTCTARRRGLLGRSFWNLRHADIGFGPTGDDVQLSLPYGRDGYTPYAQERRVPGEVGGSPDALPGVTAVAAADSTSADESAAHRFSTCNFRPPTGPAGRRSRPRTTWQAPATSVRWESRCVRGGLPGRRSARHAGRGDQRTRRQEPIRNHGRHWPARMWNERTPVVPSTTFKIVGVVGDVPWGRIEDGDVPMVYFPFLARRRRAPGRQRPGAVRGAGGPVCDSWDPIASGADDPEDCGRTRRSSTCGERPHPRVDRGRRHRPCASHHAADRDGRRGRPIAWRDRGVQRGVVRSERAGARIRNPSRARRRAEPRGRHGAGRWAQGRRDSAPAGASSQRSARRDSCARSSMRWDRRVSRSSGARRRCSWW